MLHRRIALFVGGGSGRHRRVLERGRQSRLQWRRQRDFESVVELANDALLGRRLLVLDEKLVKPSDG
jgi:hypothetical protein